MFDDREYLIFPITEIYKVDFSLICESSIETIRKSVDGTKTFIKWNGEPPEFISNLENTEGPYTNLEILEILDTPEWKFPYISVESTEQ